VAVDGECRAGKLHVVFEETAVEASQPVVRKMQDRRTDLKERFAIVVEQQHFHERRAALELPDEASAAAVIDSGEGRIDAEAAQDAVDARSDRREFRVKLGVRSIIHSNDYELRRQSWQRIAVDAVSSA